MPKRSSYNPERSRSGFTLIELLIVITIIAVLSTIAILIYSSVTMNARDARRKLDLQNIAQALEVYYQKNGRYPVTRSGWEYSSYGVWDDGLGLVPIYMSEFPHDPKRNDSDFWRFNDERYGYGYCSDQCFGGAAACYNTNGQAYVLMAKLENHNDPDTNFRRHYKMCNGGDFNNYSSYLYIITPNQ